jgi:hypothetical protein
LFAISFVISSAVHAAPLPPFEVLKVDSAQLTWTKTENVGENVLSSRVETFKRMLKPQVDPYWGTSHVSATCDPARLPRNRKSEDSRQKGETLYLYATQNRRFGLCSERFETLRAQILLLYCKDERALYEIRHFAPREREWQLDPVARCR